MSQHYPVSAPLEGLSQARTADVRFYRETRLPPGRYTVEAVVHDLLADKVGAVRARLDVPPAPDGRLRASSLVLVERAEKAPSAGGESPLLFHDVWLHPNVGSPLSREEGHDLTFFVTAWPSADRPEVDARVEVMRDGQRVAATPPAHLRPDEDGRIRLASSLPLAAFTPGAYELRVTLSDGRDAETRTTSFPVAP
jgi:hypothetical protein